ncbi:MAG TPA: SPW repeat protein [Thermomicrobiales bacterium]
MSARGPVAIAFGLIVLICIWLFVTPWVLRYADTAGWNATIVAAVIAALAAYQLVSDAEAESRRIVSWLIIILCAWLVISPWILSGYEENSEKWNSVIVGIVIALLTLWGSRSESAVSANA